MQLFGKVAIVTGGAGGIGKAIVDAFLGKGVKVCIADVNEVLGRETCTTLGLKHDRKHVIFHRCDVTDEESFKDTFQKTRDTFCGLDIVVNNAGVIEEKQWQKALDINVGGVIRGIKLGFHWMSTKTGNKGGSIINVSSIAGVGYAPVLPIYCATKTAIVGLTRSFGSKPYLTEHNIRVNCICPSVIDTPIHNLSDEQADTADAYQKFIDRNPSMPPSRVADGVIMVLEDKSQNGKALTVTCESGLKYWDFPKAKY